VRVCAVFHAEALRRSERTDRCFGNAALVVA